MMIAINLEVVAIWIVLVFTVCDIGIGVVWIYYKLKERKDKENV